MGHDNLVIQGAGDRRKRAEEALTGASRTRVAALLDTCDLSKQLRYAVRAEKVAKGGQAEAIRLKCAECCCWNAAEVEQCPITGCALHGFRSKNEKRRQREGVVQDRVQKSNDSTGDSTGG